MTRPEDLELFQEYLMPFREYILTHYEELPDEGLILYRNSQELPPNDWDQLPPALRNNSKPGVKKIGRKYTDEEVRQMGNEEALQALGKYALSFNFMPESIQTGVKRTYDYKRNKGAKEKDLAVYRQYRGDLVGPYKLFKGDGLVSYSDSSDHVNILLNKDVKLSDRWIKDMTSYHIDWDKSE